jgi:hypothetical protein
MAGPISLPATKRATRARLDGPGEAGAGRVAEALVEIVRLRRKGKGRPRTRGIVARVDHRSSTVRRKSEESGVTGEAVRAKRRARCTTRRVSAGATIRPHVIDHRSSRVGPSSPSRLDERLRSPPCPSLSSVPTATQVSCPSRTHAFDRRFTRIPPTILVASDPVSILIAPKPSDVGRDNATIPIAAE